MFAQQRISQSVVEAGSPVIALQQVELLLLCSNPAGIGLLASANNDFERLIDWELTNIEHGNLKNRENATSLITR
jgi:hypothetical protein